MKILLDSDPGGGDQRQPIPPNVLSEGLDPTPHRLKEETGVNSTAALSSFAR